MELLNKIQKELKAPKNLRNTFGNYNYRSAESILDAVKPLLESGTITCSDELVMIGTRFYVKATATLSDGKESISTTAFAREAETKKGMDESQITGATSSYARKYALNGLFAIDDIKDSDSLDNREKPENQPGVPIPPKIKPPTPPVPTLGTNKLATKDQVREIEDLLTTSTIDDEARKRANGLILKGLTSLKYTEMKDYLTKNQYNER
jgi:hypothetical protein